MSEQRILLPKAYLVFRLLFFGLGGLFVSFCSFLPVKDHVLWPVVRPSLMLAGALMSLYGVGKWARWTYLWAILVVPFLILFLWPMAPFLVFVGALMSLYSLRSWVHKRKHSGN